mgnify:CR=1 FL=1
MKIIRATVSEGDRMWCAHGKTREEALHHLRIVVNGEIRSGIVKFENVETDDILNSTPTPGTPSDAPTA